MAADTGGESRDARVPRTDHRVGLSSTGVFLINVAIQGIGYGANYFLYHHVGYDDPGKALLGTVLLYLLISSSINGLGDLRIGTAYTYFVARGQSPREATGTYLALRLGMVSAAGAVLFVLGVLPGTPFTYASTPEEFEALGLFMGLPVLWSIQTVYTQLAVAQGRSTAGQIPLLIETVVRTPILIWVAFNHPSIAGLTLAYVPGAVASTLYCAVPIARVTRAISRAEAVRLFRYAWPLMGSLVLLYLANNTPPLMVNAYLGTADLTNFSAANAWRILALTLPAAISTPLFPYLSGLHREREYASVRSGTWRALRYTAMVVFPAVMAMIVYRVNLLNIFATAAYVAPGAIPLALLAASVMPAALSQIIGTSLNAIGYQRLELYLTSLQVAVLFGVAAILLPPIALFALPGLYAISIAILASTAAALAVNTYFMERLLAVQIPLRPAVGILGSAAVGFFVVSQFNDLVPVGRYYELALGVLLGFAAYFLVLAAVGELSRDDVRYLSGAVGLPSRVGEALSRLCWRRTSPIVNDAPLSSARGLTEPPAPAEPKGPSPPKPLE